MMLDILTIGVLAGIILGLRFNVLILVPALTVASLIAAVAGIANGDSFWLIVVAIVLLGTAIQIGYLFGIVLRPMLASICAPYIGSCNSRVGHP